MKTLSNMARHNIFLRLAIVALISLISISCGYKVTYNLSGGSIPPEAKTFSSYADYDSSQLLIDVQDQLIEEIVEALVNDIYMAAAGNW